VGRHRAGQQEALVDIASERAQQIQLAGCLYALRHYFEVEAVRQRDDSFH